MISALEAIDQAIAYQYPALDLALNYHVDSKRGLPLDLTKWHFQVPILKDDSQRIVVMKPVQIGASEVFIIKSLNKLMCSWSVIYSLPIESLRNTFVANRIDKPLNRVPLYREGLKCATGRSDQVGMKHLWGGVIKFVGSNSDSSFLEFPADLLIVDEKDKSDIDNLKMAPDRLDASEHKYIWEIGNPTHSKFGIHKAYLESDRKKWNIKCPACNQWQELDFFKNVVRRIDENRYELIDKWIPNDNRDINVYCKHCLAPMDRLMAGEYVAEFLERSISGYHISQLFSPTKSIRELWEMFQEAQTNLTIMQVFHNSRLGLPYEGVGDYLTAALLEAKCMQDYLMPSTARVDAKATMGVDVGAKLHTIIRDKKGRALYINAVHSFDELTTLTKKYKVDFVVIDALPETHKVTEWQEFINDNTDTKVWRCYYSNIKEFWKFDENTRVLNVERTQSIDAMVSEILRGKKYLPKDFRSLDKGNYVEQMEAPKRKFDDTGKVPRYVWDEEGKPDHYFHADNCQSLARKVQEEIGDLQPSVMFG